jgi:hypothetical protein
LNFLHLNAALKCSIDITLPTILQRVR